jgi:hypothetical protein
VLLKLVNIKEAGGSKDKPPNDKMNYHAVREEMEINGTKLADKPADLPVVRDIKITGPDSNIPALYSTSYLLYNRLGLRPGLYKLILMIA